MAEKIYYDMQNDVAYREDNTDAVNDNVIEFRYKEVKTLQIQLLASDSKDGSGDFDDEYTGLTGTSVTATCAVDNNAVHYYDGEVNTAITGSVQISTIKIDNLGGTPRIAGRLKLTNSGGDTETINYNGFTLDDGVYTFTLADADYDVAAQTPTYSYAEDDDCRVKELPIVKDASVDVTDKNTGLFEAELDCHNIIYQNLIEGTEEISDCKCELQVLDGSSNVILAKEFKVKCLYLLDDDGGVAPAPSFPDTDIVFNDSTKGIVLTGRPNGNQYRFWIDDTIPGAPIISIEDYP